MQKSSECESPVLDVIRDRRSRRAYDSTPISEDIIRSLFEAARWAPSSVNEQPWLYIYAHKGQELWSAIFESLNDANKIWAESAPLLVASLTRNRFLRNDRPNTSARYDLGAANAFLSLQATHHGLNVHQMGGFNTDKLREALSVPEDFDPVVVMAVGFPASADILPEPLKLRELAPRERYLQKEFVMNRKF